MSDPTTLGPDPKALGYAGLHDPSDLGLRSHTQVTWVRRPFPTPFFLGLEEDVRPKLIIILNLFDSSFYSNNCFFLISNDDDNNNNNCYFFYFFLCRVCKPQARVGKDPSVRVCTQRMVLQAQASGLQTLGARVWF